MALLLPTYYLPIRIGGGGGGGQIDPPGGPPLRNMDGPFLPNVRTPSQIVGSDTADTTNGGHQLYSELNTWPSFVPLCGAAQTA